MAALSAPRRLLSFQRQAGSAGPVRCSAGACSSYYKGTTYCHTLPATWDGIIWELAEVLANGCGRQLAFGSARPHAAGGQSRRDPGYG